jgi:hypothetical protein
MTVFWDVFPCSLLEIDRCFRGSSALMKEAVKTSETFVSFYQTTRFNIQENSDLHIRRHEKCLSYQLFLKFAQNNSCPHVSTR